MQEVSGRRAEEETRHPNALYACAKCPVVVQPEDKHDRIADTDKYEATIVMLPPDNQENRGH